MQSVPSGPYLTLLDTSCTSWELLSAMRRPKGPEAQKSKGLKAVAHRVSATVPICIWPPSVQVAALCDSRRKGEMRTSLLGLTCFPTSAHVAHIHRADPIPPVGAVSAPAVANHIGVDRGRGTH